MTIAEAEKEIIENLIPIYEPDEAKSLACVTISHVCKLSRTQYLYSKNEVLLSINKTSILHILKELIAGKPLQYSLGETEFYGLVFKVNPSVLIPRPETEELVDWIFKEFKGNGMGEKPLKILDIGTGSGCIPIVLKKYMPKAEVYAMDISAEALATARNNALLNQTDVVFFEDDILNPAFNLQSSIFNIIISNPPYITHPEKEQMHQNVLAYEPHTALFVPDNDPLIFYNAIADYALNHLKKPGGLLFFEINENSGFQTVTLLKNKGFKNIELRQDLRGKDRMIKCELAITF